MEKVWGGRKKNRLRDKKTAEDREKVDTWEAWKQVDTSLVFCLKTGFLSSWDSGQRDAEAEEVLSGRSRAERLKQKRRTTRRSMTSIWIHTSHGIL